MKYPEIISASAGSGKTYTITERIFEAIASGSLSPERIIATTFTNKAAAELKGRIREKLISEGKTIEANQMNEALIGTINSVCFKLLKKYAFQAGISPDLKTLDDNDQKIILRELVSNVLDDDFLELATKLFQAESNDFFMKGTPYLDQIEDLILQLKVNVLSKEDLESFADQSIADYFSLFSSQINDHDLIKGRVLPLLKAAFDFKPTRKHSDKSRKDLAALEDIYHNIKYDQFTWDEWFKLKKIGLAKSFLPEGFKEELGEIIGKLASHNQFREDYSLYVKRCFKYAKEVIDSYDAYKLKRGLLDFSDQESKIYELIIDNESVRKELASSYDLIVVDEFQDVSPLQLDIFLKLTQLIKQNIWVGDPKQSIYAFRGADPKLMQSVVQAIPPESKSQLTASYRSRKSLIDFSNLIFSEAFSETMEEKSVVLKQGDLGITKRKANEETILNPAINYWKFADKPTIQKSIESLTVRIIELLATEPQVFDKNTKEYRAANCGDIAILCRSNNRCQVLGQTLAQAGLPVAAAGYGLIGEPEIVFVRALLKLMIYPRDSLAKAEVFLYSRFNGSQEAMISDRLKYENNKDWHRDDIYFEQLDRVRAYAYDYGPVRSIEALTTELDLERLFASWGDLDRRVANIDALILHAKEYQETFKRLQNAATIGGFLNWLNDLHDTNEDTKGVQTGEVIQITTYHKSKGLEWPIVILWDLDTKPREKFFGVSVISENKISLEEPLANRQLRLFVKPFGRSKVESFMESIEKSADMKAAVYHSAEEEKRLLYVAITRARDYVYLTYTKGKLTIPDIVNSKLDQFAQPDGLNDSELKWNEAAIPFQNETIADKSDVDLTSFVKDNARLYFPVPKGRQEHQLQKLSPSSAVSLASAGVSHTETIHDRLYINRSKVSDSEFGTFIHNIYCAFDPDWPKATSLIWLEEKVKNSSFSELIDAIWLHKAILSFHDFLKDSYVEYTLHKELPIQAINEQGQHIEGYVDLVVEVGNVLLIIDYKTFSIKDYSASVYKKKALAFSGQLALYKKVLEKSFGKKVDGTFLYFVFEGKMLEVSSSNI